MEDKRIVVRIREDKLEEMNDIMDFAIRCIVGTVILIAVVGIVLLVV